jgi:hypothetical protein
VDHGAGQDILKMIYIALPEVKRKFFSRQARKLVNIPTMLFRLQIVMVNCNETNSQYVISLSILLRNRDADSFLEILKQTVKFLIF